MLCVHGSPLYQWDRNRQIKIDSVDVGSNFEIHCCHKDDTSSLVVAPIFEGEAVLVNIPNILLQRSGFLRAYVVIGGDTIYDQTFYVMARQKPDDYIYTETEVLSYSSLEKRISHLEKGGGSSGVYIGGGEMPDGYNVQIDPDGEYPPLVQTVNGKTPDADGNVEIEGGSGGDSSADWELIEETELLEDIAQYSTTFEKGYTEISIQWWGVANDIDNTLNSGSATGYVRINGSSASNTVMKTTFGLCRKKIDNEPIPSSAKLECIGAMVHAAMCGFSGADTKNSTKPIASSEITQCSIGLVEPHYFKAGGTMKIYGRA